MNMKKINTKPLLFFTGILGLTAVLFIAIYGGDVKDKKITPIDVDTDRTVLLIDTEKEEISIEVDIADTESERAQGLSGRTAIGAKEGMLFVFETSRIPQFWMKDMNFALDMIWIDDTLTVVGFSQNVTPESFPKTFFPEVSVKYVLEVNENFVNSNNIKKGDTLQILTL